MQIAIELPNDFVTFQGLSQVQQEVRISYALWLYQQSRVTLSKAAELAGMDLYAFMEVCKTSKISTMGFSPEELAEDLAGASAP